jgi:aminoglycoside phosphotransferase (APT) family kinase protein
MVGPVRDWVHLANQVAEALAALQAVDVAGAPPSGPRGGLLADRDRAVRWAIAQLDDVLASERATAVWEAGLDARPWTKRPVWVHGDLLPGNLLLRDDQLIGIIDWGAAGVGDPACDAMLAWAMPADARHDFHLAAGFDEDTWVRGKAWALEQAVFFAPYYAETIPEAAAAARRRLAAILAERPPVGGKRGRD